MRVAYYSPLPPERSGIADYSALLLPALGRLLEVEVVRRGRVRPVGADVALYHVGNDPEAHGWIVEALRRRPGVVVLHEFVLHHLVAGVTLGRKDGPAYLAAMERDAGIPGRLLAHGVLEGRVPPLWEVRPDEFPLVGEVLDLAEGLIVHSRYVEERTRLAGYEGPLWRIPHPAWPPPRPEPAAIEGRPLFGCFGHLNASKRIPQLLEAFELVRGRHPGARLLLVGPTSPGFRLPTGGEGVAREDYVDERRLWELMAACDACISLRAPTMGETSGSAVRALSLGKPLVVSDVGWFAELPDSVALKVAPDSDEVAALAAALDLLASSEAERDARSRGARAYAEREHGLERVAERYAAALEEAAGGGAVADAVVREIAEAAAEVGIGADDPTTAELAVRLDEIGIRDGRPSHGKPGPTPRRRPGAVLILLLLGALVAASTLGRYALARRLGAPWIMVDELIYSELAKSFAATGEFLIRGVHAGAYGIVYPILISPAYRLADEPQDAYAAAKAIGSLTMSLAALPAYLLARRVLTPVASFAAAVLALLVPSMVYTGTLMTETAFYPIFLCVALALVWALERPTATRQLLLLGVCLVAFLTRTQAVVLVPAVATAPLLLAWFDRRRLRAALGSFCVLYGVLAAAVAAVVIVQIARGHSPYDVLGRYSVTGHADYRVGDILRWLLYHVAELDLYLGIVPFAVLLLAAAAGRTLDPPLRAVVAATVALSGWLVLEVAAFASTQSLRVEERNLFYVAPLFLVVLLAWIDRGLPRPRRAAAVCAVVAAALPGLLPYDRLIAPSAESDTLALLPLWWLQEGIVALRTIPAVVAVAAIALAALFLVLPRRFALVLPLLVGAWFVFTSERAQFFDHGFEQASQGALFQGITNPRRNWVDFRVGVNADVAFVFPGTNRSEQPLTLWENEFFNRSVGTVYDLRGPSMGDLPETRLRQRRDGVLLAHGRPVRHEYVLAEAAVPLAGEPVAGDPGRGMVLLRQDGPLRIAYRTSGLYPGDTWSGKTVTYTRLRCAGGSVAVRLRGDRSLFDSPQRVSARSGGVVRRAAVPVDDARTATLVVPLQPRGRDCRVTFTVGRTVIPALVVPASADTRRLGVHFLEFRYLPPGA